MRVMGSRGPHATCGIWVSAGERDERPFWGERGKDLTPQRQSPVEHRPPGAFWVEDTMKTRWPC